MYPEHVAPARSNLDPGNLPLSPPTVRVPPPGGLRPLERWGLDANAFADAIEASLQNRSAMSPDGLAG